MKKLRSLFFAVLLALGSLPLSAQQLYVGANYHPHDDKNPEKIARDIRLMQEAGFNVTRLGHLAWDSFEPSDGVFDFEWFDRVMDGMAEAGKTPSRATALHFEIYRHNPKVKAIVLTQCPSLMGFCTTDATFNVRTISRRRAS